MTTVLGRPATIIFAPKRKLVPMKGGFVLAPMVMLAICRSAVAQIVLDPVEVIAAPLPAELGTAETASEGQVSRERIEARPVIRPGEVLETVPGLIVTQHRGEGKANQYFLRGFNLDHGTDFAISVDGMPINMPTHGHGQGYADVNWLMPELAQPASNLPKRAIFRRRRVTSPRRGAAHIEFQEQCSITIFLTGDRRELGYGRALGATSAVASAERAVFISSCGSSRQI